MIISISYTEATEHYYYRWSYTTVYTLVNIINEPMNNISMMAFITLAKGHSTYYTLGVVLRVAYNIIQDSSTVCCN